MRSEISASFLLSGDQLDPNEVTAATGIEPTASHRAGDVITYPRRTLRAAAGRWWVESSLPLSASLDAHVKELLNHLEPAWPALIALGEVYKAELSCLVRSYGGDRPPIGFDSQMVRRCAELSADIDVDLYIFDDD